jgi:hypothetical protein
MSLRKLAFVTLLFAPTVLLAQRGGGGAGRVERGDRRPNYDEMSKTTTPGLQLSNRDVEDVSPLHLLLDKRKDLKLSDDQQKQIKDLENKMKETVKPSFKTLDSLRAVMKRPSGTLSDEERAQVTLARQDVGRVVGEIRDAYGASLKETMALLNPEQQKTAQELVHKQSQDAEQMLREKMGGGRGRP